jgi:hypothetical protein
VLQDLVEGRKAHGRHSAKVRATALAVASLTTVATGAALLSTSGGTAAVASAAHTRPSSPRSGSLALRSHRSVAPHPAAVHASASHASASPASASHASASHASANHASASHPRAGRGAAAHATPSPASVSPTAPSPQSAVVARAKQHSRFGQLATVSSNFHFEVLGASSQPVRWDPCDPITYAVVGTDAPTGWQGDVASVVSQVSTATGMNFVDSGTFAQASQVPSNTDITISWTSALVSTGGDEVGLTTYYYIDSAPYTPQMTKAQIQMLGSLHAGAGTDGELPVLLHEMGHAMGLAHTPGQPEVMNPVDQGFTHYQPGDTAGLHALGAAQGCKGFYS